MNERQGVRSMFSMELYSWIVLVDNLLRILSFIGIFCIKEVSWVFHVVERDRSAPSLSPPVCVNQSSENLLISLITSNFSETCQAVDHAAENRRRRRSEKLIHTVITRSSRAAGGRENAIICLINSNFWWNMSSLVSFSVSVWLADYYNKTHLDQVTSIKTSQLSVNTRLWLGLSYNFLFSHRCQNLLDYFNQIWKLHKKKLASSPAEQEKMISNRLVRQFLVRAAFSPNNGAGWVFSETYKEWAWLSSSAGRPKTITKRGGLCWWIEKNTWSDILCRVWSWLAGWCANYPRHDRLHSHSLNFQRLTCLLLLLLLLVLTDLMIC